MSEEMDEAELPLDDVKPAAKKAAKKSAKKAAKKVSKKVSKKAGKKAAKKAVKKVEAEVEAGLDQPTPEAPAREAGHAPEGGEKKVGRVDLREKNEELGKKKRGKDGDEAAVGEAGEEKDEVTEISTVKEEEPPASPPPPPPEVPETASLSVMRELPLGKLYELAEELPVKIPSRTDKAQLVFLILSCYLKYGTEVEASGVLEQAKENYGMLRDPARSFRTSPDDIYVPGHMLKDCGARVGQMLRVKLRAPRERDNYLSATEVLEVEGIEVEEFEARKPFDELTSLFPEERFLLDDGEEGGLAVRVVDLIAPLGKGQRGLIVAPPRGGKTILLKQIARSLQKNHPESELIILLLDERPEEVTDFEEMVGGNVFASTFDEPSKRHAQVSDIVLERARRLVEMGKDVVILLDSLTRLARGYNNAISGGPIGSGGLSPKAVTETRKFFGAARKVEEGGSLTILATCLVETESRLDDVIFEELKGTGNMEVRLDRILAEQRIYPAIHIPQSGTRNDDRLYHAEEFQKVLEIRRHLAALPVGEALETLLGQLSKTKTNTELLLKGLR